MKFVKLSRGHADYREALIAAMGDVIGAITKLDLGLSVVSEPSELLPSYPDPLA